MLQSSHIHNKNLSLDSEVNIDKFFRTFISPAPKVTEYLIKDTIHLRGRVIDRVGIYADYYNKFNDSAFILLPFCGLSILDFGKDGLINTYCNEEGVHCEIDPDIAPIEVLQQLDTYGAEYDLLGKHMMVFTPKSIFEIDYQFLLEGKCSKISPSAAVVIKIANDFEFYLQSDLDKGDNIIDILPYTLFYSDYYKEYKNYRAKEEGIEKPYPKISYNIILDTADANIYQKGLRFMFLYDTGFCYKIPTTRPSLWLERVEQLRNLGISTPNPEPTVEVVNKEGKEALYKTDYNEWVVEVDKFVQEYELMSKFYFEVDKGFDVTPENIKEFYDSSNENILYRYKILKFLKDYDLDEDTLQLIVSSSTLTLEDGVYVDSKNKKKKISLFGQEIK